MDFHFSFIIHSIHSLCSLELSKVIAAVFLYTIANAICQTNSVGGIFGGTFLLFLHFLFVRLNFLWVVLLSVYSAMVVFSVHTLPSV